MVHFDANPVIIWYLVTELWSIYQCWKQYKQKEFELFLCQYFKNNSFNSSLKLTHTIKCKTRFYCVFFELLWNVYSYIHIQFIIHFLKCQIIRCKILMRVFTFSLFLLRKKLKKFLGKTARRIKDAAEEAFQHEEDFSDDESLPDRVMKVKCYCAHLHMTMRPHVFPNYTGCQSGRGSISRY